MRGIWLQRFAKVCVNQAIRVTKLQSSRDGRMADQSDCQNLLMSWSPIRWRQLSVASMRRVQQKRRPQAFRLFS